LKLTIQQQKFLAQRNFVLQVANITYDDKQVQTMRTSLLVTTASITLAKFKRNQNVHVYTLTTWAYWYRDEGVQFTNVWNDIFCMDTCPKSLCFRL